MNNLLSQPTAWHSRRNFAAGLVISKDFDQSAAIIYAVRNDSALSFGLPADETFEKVSISASDIEKIAISINSGENRFAFFAPALRSATSRARN